VLDLVGEGLTNRQIAERMVLSEKTVKNYVSALLTKLGMHRRSQAAAMAARLGERPATGIVLAIVPIAPAAGTIICRMRPRGRLSRASFES
jgi:hypothetical protein